MKNKEKKQEKEVKKTALEDIFESEKNIEKPKNKVAEIFEIEKPKEFPIKMIHAWGMTKKTKKK